MEKRGGCLLKEEVWPLFRRLALGARRSAFVSRPARRQGGTRIDVRSGRWGLSINAGLGLATDRRSPAVALGRGRGQRRRRRGRYSRTPVRVLGTVEHYWRLGPLMRNRMRRRHAGAARAV
ncbi:atherin-like [Iris pallida]|uniref:Atherin-like n=1 Tax=Iris pallida TaxID=29817 RepID=A0AAX6G5Z8_IRIPA|nr:atherin-like [Iris pallida]